MKLMRAKEKTISILQILLVCIFSSILFTGCATYSSAPGGGPQDKHAPNLLWAIPMEGTTNFKATIVKLGFDEFVELKESEKIISSPPLKKTYYSYNLKQVKIEIQDSLQADRTYCINFKKSLVDLHEANPVTNFKYVFSTSNVIDSAYLNGYVYDALALKPAKEAHVMLYFKTDTNLGFPILKVPQYVSVTDENGYFEVDYIKPGCYYVLAGSDENRDFLIEPLSENMAYSSFCWTTETLQKQVNFVEDTVFALGDSLARHRYDSLKIVQENAAQYLAIEKGHILYMYKDRLKKHFLGEAKLDKKGSIKMNFNYPIDQLTYELLPVDTNMLPFRSAIEWSMDRRSANLFFSNMDIVEAKLILHQDTYTDTVELFMNESAQNARDTTVFKISSNAKTHFFITDTLCLSFSLPLIGMDTTKGKCLEIGEKDTNIVHGKWIQTAANTVQIIYEWKPEHKYLLFFPPKSFVDIFGRTNDTTFIRLSTDALDHYGSLALHLPKLPKGDRFVLQVLNEKQEVLSSKIVLDTACIEFPYLEPGQITFCLFRDDNKNGRWDQGVYVDKIQPEKRWYFPKLIRIEEDWRVEEKWVLPED